MASQLAITTICVVLAFQIMQIEGIDPFTVAAVVAKVISVSGPLALTTIRDLMGTSYRVTVGMEIENWTQLQLRDPAVTISNGAIEVPPIEIKPNYKAAMVARKTAYTATGSFGVVSWEIGNTGHRVVILWSAPFNFDFYKNWLAVGITKRKSKHDSQWVDKMYRNGGDHPIWFDRAEYHRNVRQVMWEDLGIGISVYATMGTTHNAVVRVFVTATNTANLAGPVQQTLNALDRPIMSEDHSQPQDSSTHAPRAFCALLLVSFVIIAAY